MTATAPTAPRRLAPDERAEEIAVLRRLQRQVELGIGCIEAGLTMKCGSNHFAATPRDFRIGDFLITDTKRGPI